MECRRIKNKDEKAKDLEKKNEGKKLKKKSENIILKNYTKKINDKVVKKNEKPKPELKPELKPVNITKSDLEEVVNAWDEKDLPRVLCMYYSEVYNKIEIIVTREIKRKNFVMPFDLMVFTKKI